MFSKSCLQINKGVTCGKEAFIISDLLEDIKCLRQENGIEVSIITSTRILKRKMIDAFTLSKEISLYPNGKCLIVQSSNVISCQYILAVLNGKGLKVTTARKLFFTINCNDRTNSPNNDRL